jgi:MFS family permease
MAGLLLGGLLWGILGDRRGRLTVLFGSILTYSLANLLNGLIHHLPQESAIPAYAALRFIAGIGLAGELGAAVTLVTEACSRERRGIATAAIASMGILGAVVAGFVARWTTWQNAYLIGGVMGLALLLTRISVGEPAIFKSLASQPHVRRGDLLGLLRNPRSRKLYLGAIAQGLPIWFVVGVLLTLTPELARELRLVGEASTGPAIMACYGGAVVGDFTAGVLSQLLRSRRAAIASFLTLTSAGLVALLNFHGRTFEEFCRLAAFLGFASGYWAVLLTSTAERFGTNLRATVTSTVPNFIRGAVIPMSSAFLALAGWFSMTAAAGTIALLVLALAAFSLWKSQETFGADLDFTDRY